VIKFSLLYAIDKVDKFGNALCKFDMQHIELLSKIIFSIVLLLSY